MRSKHHLLLVSPWLLLVIIYLLNIRWIGVKEVLNIKKDGGLILDSNLLQLLLVTKECPPLQVI